MAETQDMLKCESCTHKKLNDNPELHCYMFKDPVMPDGECMQHSNLNDVRRVFSRIFPIHLLADILTVNIGNREPNSVHYKQKFGRSLPDDIMALTKDYVIENEQDFDRIHYLGDWLADVVGSDEDHLMHPNFMVVCDLIEKWESVNVNLGEEDGSNSQA